MNLGLRAAARELGLSHPGLKKAADDGRVTREPDGKFNVEKVRAQIAANSHPIKAKSARAQQSKPARPSAKPEADEIAVEFDLNRIVTARERVKLEKDQLDLARRKGEVVDKAAVNAFVAGMILKARDVFLQVPPSLRDKLAKIDDPVECEAVLMSEIHRGLRHLC